MPPSPDHSSEIHSKVDLDLAIRRVRGNIKSSAFPNHVDATILQRFPGDVKKRVEKLLDDATMDWANGSAKVFDLPKNDGLVRPICHMDVEVAVAYQALVDAASTTIERHISAKYEDRILSHRLKAPPSPTMFLPSSETYKKFIDLQHQTAASGMYSHCLRLDIANYYERIYQHKLQQLLERHDVPGVITSALCRLLRKFSNGILTAYHRACGLQTTLGMPIYSIWMSFYILRAFTPFVTWMTIESSALPIERRN